jgi:hypothetical protein
MENGELKINMIVFGRYRGLRVSWVRAWMERKRPIRVIARAVRIGENCMIHFKLKAFGPIHFSMENFEKKCFE